MRKLILAASLALLAGCGDGGEDFSVDVAMAPENVRAELMRLDGGSMLPALSFPRLSPAALDEDAIRIAFTGDNGEESGTLLMRVEGLSAKSSRIHVALDLPEAQAKIRGKQMVLSEAKAEGILRTRLGTWARGVASSGYGSLDSVNQVLSGLALAVRPAQYEKVIGAVDDPAAFNGLLDSEFLAAGDGGYASDIPEAGDLDAASPEPADPSFAEAGDDAVDESGGWANE
jgi:hypothetical protein